MNQCLSAEVGEGGTINYIIRIFTQEHPTKPNYSLAMAGSALTVMVSSGLLNVDLYCARCCKEMILSRETTRMRIGGKPPIDLQI